MFSETCSLIFPLSYVAEQHYVIALCNLQCLELTGQFASVFILPLEALFRREVQGFSRKTKKVFPLLGALDQNYAKDA